MTEIAYCEGHGFDAQGRLFRCQLVRHSAGLHAWRPEGKGGPWIYEWCEPYECGFIPERKLTAEQAAAFAAIGRWLEGR